MGYHDYVNRKIKEAVGALRPEINKALQRALKDPRMKDERTPKNETVREGKFHPDLKTGATQTTYAPRKIGRGNGNDVSAADHSHNTSSINFNHGYSRAERRRTLDLRKQVETMSDEAPLGFDTFAWKGIAALKHLTLDAIHQLADHPLMTADEVEDRCDRNSLFRHLYFMAYRLDYQARYHYETDPEFRARIDADHASDQPHSTEELDRLAESPTLEHPHLEYDSEFWADEAWRRRAARVARMGITFERLANGRGKAPLYPHDHDPKGG